MNIVMEIKRANGTLTRLLLILVLIGGMTALAYSSRAETGSQGIALQVCLASGHPTAADYVRKTTVSGATLWVSESKENCERLLYEDTEFISLSEGSKDSSITVSLTRRAGQRIRRLTKGRAEQKLVAVVNGFVAEVSSIVTDPLDSLTIKGIPKHDGQRMATAISGGPAFAVHPAPTDAGGQRLPRKDGSDWPSYVRESIWIAPDAKELDYAFTGAFQITYQAGPCRPASQLVKTLVQTMTARGWKRLSTDPLFPEKQASYASDKSDSWDNGWAEYWCDDKGNFLFYWFWYDKGGDESSHAACSLRAKAQFFTDTFFNLAKQATIAIRSVKGAKKGVDDWPQYVRDSIWFPDTPQEPNYTLFSGSYQVDYRVNVCIPTMKAKIEQMVQTMTARGWKRLSIDPFNPPQKLSHAQESEDPRLSKHGWDWGMGAAWEEYWQDKSGNTIFYRFGYQTKREPGQPFPMTPVDSCSVSGWAFFFPAAVWDAEMKYLSEIRKYTHGDQDSATRAIFKSTNVR